MAKSVDISTDSNQVLQLDETLKSCLEVEKHILATKNDLNIPGISFRDFFETKLDEIDPQVAGKLSEMFKEFEEGNNELTLLLLHKTLNTIHQDRKQFNNFERYIWLLKLYCKCLLLRSDEVEFDYSMEEAKLKQQLLDMNVDSITFDPVKIHIIAKALFESVLTDNLNLIYVINKLATMNKLLFFVSITLVFAGLFRLTKRKITMFRMFSSKKVLNILKGLQIENPQQRMDYKQLYSILRCVSCYQHLVLYHVAKRNDFKTEYRGYSSYFKHNDKVLNDIWLWLDRSKHYIDSVRSKTGFNTAQTIFFHIYELIELDMAYIMEMKKSDHQLTKYGYNF